MRYKRLLGTGIMIAVLMVTTQCAVATMLYDGAVGDADPVTQGYLGLTVGGTSSATPDAVNDLVNMSGDDVKYKHTSAGVTAIAAEVGNDVYTLEWVWEQKSGHTAIGEVDLITGLSSGSAGYRDRFMHRVAYISIVYGTADPGYSLAVQPSVHGGTAWTTMNAKNTYRWERNGNATKLYANDHLVYAGTGGASGIGSTQLEIRDNGVIDVDLYSVEITPEPATMLMLVVGGVATLMRRRRA